MVQGAGLGPFGELPGPPGSVSGTQEAHVFRTSRVFSPVKLLFVTGDSAKNLEGWREITFLPLQCQALQVNH